MIVTAVDQLPVLQAEAESELVRLAAHHDAGELRLLEKRILDVVAPEIAEPHERQALEREDKRAAEACRFTISDDGHGQCHGRFTLPTHVGAMLKQAVLAINAPKHRHHSGTPQGLGDAFCEYVTRYPLDRLPKAGGVGATVVVTMTLDNLTGESDAPSLLGTGDRITAGQARKLASKPGSSRSSWPADHRSPRRPQVPLPPSPPTDRDPSPRPALHRPGCDWPGALCHVHHNESWSRGGKTSVTDGRLLFPKHHTFADSPKYTMKTIPNGRVVFSRS